MNTDSNGFFCLLFFYCRDYDWSDDESDSDFDNIHQHDEYSHSEIINQCNFGSEHIINARFPHKHAYKTKQTQVHKTLYHSV